MYTGNLIERLMAAVERVAGSQVERETAELERLYLAASAEPAIVYETKLVEVA